MKDQKIDYSAHYLKIIIEANNHITELSEEKDILVQKLIARPSALILFFSSIFSLFL